MADLYDKKEFEKCARCRVRHKKCMSVAGQKRCRKCIDQNQPCGPRTRADGQLTIASHKDHEYLATLTALNILVLVLEQQCQQLEGLMTRTSQDISNLAGPSSIPKTWLDFLLEPFVGRLKDARLALRTILMALVDCLQAPWIEGYARQKLLMGLNFFTPHHNSGPESEVSTRHAQGISATVRNIQRRVPGRSSCFTTPGEPKDRQERMEWFQKTASQVQQLLTCALSLSGLLGLKGMSKVLDLRFGFPAAHIAYLNDDWDSAVELWKFEKRLDMLGRSLHHLAAESGDLEMLRRLWEIDRNGFNTKNVDYRGFSVFGIAVCKGFAHIVSALVTAMRQELAGSDLHRRLLYFGIASGNASVVKSIVDSNITSASFADEIEMVIELGRADVATVFLPSLEYDVSRQAIDKLANSALRAAQMLQDDPSKFIQCEQMRRLHRDLRGIQPKRAGRREALEDLHRILPHTGSPN